jgi:hypothetical protein
MKSITSEEARWWSSQESTSLKLTDEDVLYYHSEAEPSFVVKSPLQHRRMVALTYEILMLSDLTTFEGGLVWMRLGQWDVGVTEYVRTGWRIIEDMRRAHGDLRTLDLAPAQLFRRDEFVELHVLLIQVMSYGLGAYFVPCVGDYFLDFQISERFVCKAKSAEKLKELYSALKKWEPSRERPVAS